MFKFIAIFSKRLADLKRIFEILAIWQELIRDNKITLKYGVLPVQLF